MEPNTSPTGYNGLVSKLSELTGVPLSIQELRKFSEPHKNNRIVAENDVFLRGSSEYFSESRFGVTFELMFKHENFTVQRVYSIKEKDTRETAKEALNVLVNMLEAPMDDRGVRKLNIGFASNKFEYMSFNMM